MMGGFRQAWVVVACGLVAACTPPVSPGPRQAACPAAPVDRSIPVPEGNEALRGRFAYHDAEGDLWIVNGDGTGRRRLTNSGEGFDFDPDWSPDGRWIVFRREGVLTGQSAASSHVFVIHVGTSEERRLSKVAGSFPAWSPDGCWIALTGRSAIEVVRPDGTDRRSLRFFGECPIWSPDSSRIAYCSNVTQGIPSDNWETWVADAEGSSRRRLTEHPAREYPVAWSPDGPEIIFSSDRAGGRTRAWVMNGDGSSQRRLTEHRADFELVVAWLSDDRLIMALDSPAEGLHGWFVTKTDGTVLSPVEILPEGICCGEGQVDYWEPSSLEP